MTVHHLHPHGDEDNLRRRLEDLERLTQSQARKIVELEAEIGERLEVIWFFAIPRWLREAVDEARETGWTVEPRRTCVVFHRLVEGPDHDYHVPWPLPDDPARIDFLRVELNGRIRAFAQAA